MSTAKALLPVESPFSTVESLFSPRRVVENTDGSFHMAASVLC